MSRQQAFTLSGDEKIDRFLRDLPQAFRKEAIESAAKPGALIVRNEARNIIPRMVGREEGYSSNGQSKSAYLARNTKALKSRSKTNPGYNVYVKGKDIPVGNRYWGVQQYAVLFGEGAYKTKKRRTRGTGANRGSFAGFGNFIAEAGEKKGTMARRMFMNNVQGIGRRYLRSKR